MGRNSELAVTIATTERLRRGTDNFRLGRSGADFSSSRSHRGRGPSSPAQFAGLAPRARNAHCGSVGRTGNLDNVTDLHPPKIELFDVAGMTNTDPKGFVRQVDRYETTEFGLYMGRPLDGHPNIAYFRSWLLPARGLRIGRWLAHPGQTLDHDVYIDVVDIEPGAVWRTRDLYLDILVRDQRDLWVLDTDEVLEAHTAGLLDRVTVQRAFERTFAAVEGIAAAGYDVERWLGLPLTWADSI